MVGPSSSHANHLPRPVVLLRYHLETGDNKLYLLSWPVRKNNFFLKLYLSYFKTKKSKALVVAPLKKGLFFAASLSLLLNISNLSVGLEFGISFDLLFSVLLLGGFHLDAGIYIVET